MSHQFIIELLGSYLIGLINWTFGTIRKFSKGISDLDRDWSLLINFFLMKFFTERFIYISKIKNRKKRENWRKTIYRIRRRKRIIYEIFVIETFTIPFNLPSKLLFTPCIRRAQTKKKKSSIFRIPQLIRKRMDNISLAAKNKITILPFIRSFPFSEWKITFESRANARYILNFRSISILDPSGNYSSVEIMESEWYVSRCHR